MKIKLLYSFFILFFLQACGVGPVHTIPDAEFEWHPIPYTTAQHYFVKNTIQGGFQLAINTQQQFDSIFGMATVMGPNGRPTPINFEKQTVLAVAISESDSVIEIQPVSLDKHNEKTQLMYRVVNKGLAGYTTHVSAILITEKLNPDSVSFVRAK